MANPLVSILTPVYNGERFLEGCIRSALKQGYDNWEYLLVDNCSTDRTPDIIADYAAQESRIRVIRHGETVTALKNHNLAVRAMSPNSQYCKVLHADDQLLPQCLEKMVAIAEAHPSVGMVGALASTGDQTVCLGMPIDQQFFSGRDIGRRALLGETYPFWSPSCILHRSQAATEREFFYHEENFHADVQSSYEILERWDFGFAHEVLTRIRDHSGSRTSQLAKPMKKLLATNLDLFCEYGPRFLDEWQYQDRLASILKHYYEHLGRSALERRDSEFWRYHSKALSRSGRPLSKARVLGNVLRELASHPKRSARRLWRSFADPSYG